MGEIARLRPGLRLHRDAVTLPDKIKALGDYTLTITLPLPTSAPAELPRALVVRVRVRSSSDSVADAVAA